MTTQTQNQLPIGMGYFSLFFINQALFALAIPFFQMSLAFDPLWLNVALALPIGVVAIIHPLLERWLNRKSQQSTELQKLIAVAVICGASFSLIWWLPFLTDSGTLWLLFFLSLIFHISGALLTIYIKGLTYVYAQDVSDKPQFFSWLGLCERSGALVYYWLFPLAQLSLWGSLFSGMAIIGSLVGLFIITTLAVIAITFLSRQTRHLGYQANTRPTALAAQSTSKINFATKEKTALLVLLSLLATKLGLISAFSSLDYYVLVYFVSMDIEQGAFWKGVISSAFAIISIALVPVLKQFLMRYNPMSVLKGIYSVSFIGAVAKWFIYTPNNEHWLMLDALLGASSFVALVVIVPMLLSDICGRHKQKENGESSQNAERKVATLQSQVTLFSILTSFIIGGALLNFIGFDAELAQAQSDQAIFYMRMALSAGCSIFNLVSLALLTLYPYNGLMSATGDMSTREK